MNWNKFFGGENGLNKTIIICIFILLIGIIPVYAANSSNTSYEKQLQANSQIHNTTYLINGLEKIHLLLSHNQQLKEDITEIFSDMNKESVSRNDPHYIIKNSKKKEAILKIVNSINQLNSNSNEIKSLINENDELKKEIKELEINETNLQEISSTKKQINSNNNQIKSLINQNEDLMKEIENIMKIYN